MSGARPAHVEIVTVRDENWSGGTRYDLLFAGHVIISSSTHGRLLGGHDAAQAIAALLARMGVSVPTKEA